MKKFAITLGIMLLFSLSHVLAQPGFDDDVTDTPIDGGVSILLIAGAAYGYKKVYKKSKNII